MKHLNSLNACKQTMTFLAGNTATEIPLQVVTSKCVHKTIQLSNQAKRFWPVTMHTLSSWHIVIAYLFPIAGFTCLPQMKTSMEGG